MSDTWTKAVELVRTGNASAVEAVLSAYPELVTTRDDAGESLLGAACRAATGDIALPPRKGGEGSLAVVRVLLEAGIDVDGANAEGWAPLHMAAMTGHVALAKVLLAAGASRAGQLMGAAGGSPMALALFYARTEMGVFLASPAVPDNLRMAAALGRDLGRFFEGEALTSAAVDGLDFYRPLALFPVWERTLGRQEVLDEALSWAARNGQCGALAELVTLGAGVNANAYRGTALLWAIYGDREEAAAWLLDHGADPDLRHDFGGSEHGKGAVAMHLAAQYGSLKSLRLLLERGADPTIRDAAYDRTPLGWAEHSGCVEAVAILREAVR